jgi:DNA polymerase III subunit beta
MKLIVIKGNLKDGLNIVERSSSENTSLPILKNVLLEAVDNKIQLTATNLEIATTSWVAGKVIEPGRITVPLNLLSGVLANLGSERLNLETKDNVLEIKTDNYKAIIQGLSAEDFPLIPRLKNETRSLDIKGDILKETLSQVLPSVQVNELRPELTAILFNFNLDHLKMVATDGFRLAEKTLAHNQFKANYEEAFRMLLPLKSAHEIARIIKENETVKIFYDSNQVLFSTEQMKFNSRVLEGNYPDYTAIIPKSFDTEILIEREELINGLKLAGVFTSKVNEIRIKIHTEKKVIEIFSTDQAGENSYLIPAKIKGNGREVSFNWKYLLDGLRALSTEEIFWGINEENKPALLRSPNDATYFYILMPILKA